MTYSKLPQISRGYVGLGAAGLVAAVSDVFSRSADWIAFFSVRSASFSAEIGEANLAV